MATIGIMSYGMPSNLKTKNTFSKLTITTGNNSNIGTSILSESSSNKLVINSNTIVKKIKDFGMIGSVNNSGTIIMRKKQKLIPLNESSSVNVSQGNFTPQPPAKGLKITATNTKTVEVKSLNQVKPPLDIVVSVGTPGRKGLPAPQAVARRNARERNRVKQVNNGFAALRQHIPEEIAKEFEAAGSSNRGSAKKLSKVETLRMAVEYIRGLEKLLGYEIPPVSPVSADEGCFSVIKDEYGPISPINDNFDDSNGTDQDLSQITDNLPNITTLNGLQYIRIPGTNTYQLLTADIFGNEENFSPLLDSCYSNGDEIIDEEIPVSMLAAVAPASTPSDVTSPPPPTSTTTVNSSLSPPTTTPSPAAGGILLQQTMSGSRGGNDHYMIAPQFQTMHETAAAAAPLPSLARVKAEPLDMVYHLQDQQHVHLSPHLDANCQGYFITTSSGENSNEEQSLFEGVVRLKKEFSDVILDTSAATLSDESMMDAIDWWEANTPKSEGSAII